jgi:WD40 repeat protein
VVYIGELYVDHLLGPVLTLAQAGVSCKWAHDSQHFLLEFFDTIHNSPSQIYHSALPFSPSSSLFHKCYAAEFSQRVKVVKGLPAKWGTCSRTVILDHSPEVLTCWKDTIAVGSTLGNITLLDGITGSQVAVLSGHTEGVGALTFSPDGTSLVSGSNDKTLKLWDTQTGGVVKTFHGHTDRVNSTSISSDCTIIASGSEDKTIRLWDIQMGECHHIMEQQEKVPWVCFSPTDPQHLISESGDVVQQWDANSCQIKSTYEGSHPAFSPDGSCFAFCQGKVITVQNSGSGEIVARFSPSSGNPDVDLDYCCFSPDGGLVAIATSSTIYVWDITGSDPYLVETFHTFAVTSITFFSSSLISASASGSVKFWQIGTSSTDSVALNTSSSPLTSAPIQSISLQAKDSIVISSDSVGVVRVWDLSTGLCKAFFQTPAKGETSRDAQMIDGKLIFVWHVEGENEIYIWDAEKGELLQTVKTCVEICNLRISGDGSKVFCKDEKSIQAWSMWTGEAVGMVELESWMRLDPLCVDGSKIQVYSEDLSIQGWDFGVSGSSPVQLSNTSSESPHLNFIKSYWRDDPSRIKDTITGKYVFQLPGRYAHTHATRWDGQHLVAGYESGEVVILDCSDMCIQ